MRIAGQQRLAALAAAAGNHPGVTAFELRQAVVEQRLFAEAGEGGEVLPVAGGEGRCVAGVIGGQNAFGLPVQIEDIEVIGAELIAYVGQQRLGAKRGGKAVGHVTGDADAVFGSERPLGDAQHVELDRRGVAVLILVDAVQIGLQALPRRRLLVEAGDVTGRTLADAQAAKQFVGVEQFRPEHFGQLAPGEAAHGFHLEQTILRVDITEGAIEVGFVLGADMRHTALVVAHGHRALQIAQLDLALARRLLAVDIPAGGAEQDNDEQGNDDQRTLHGDSLCRRKGRPSGCKHLAQSICAVQRCP